MKRALVAVAVACATVLALASPAAAYTPPETDPRIVMTTSEGTILIALAPENAPKHVEQFLIALAAGDFKGAGVARVSPKFYVQLVGKLGGAQLSGLQNEHEKVGNLHGALSVYDSGKPGEIPTLLFVLVSSPQLDVDYTSIGFVEAGMSILEKMAESPTVGDHQPTKPITITEIHFASPQERATLRQAEKTPAESDGTALLAAVFILAFAAFVAAAISAFRDRLNKQWIRSMWMMVGLLVFFAVWVAIGASSHASGLVGVALFAGAIAMFRFMGRFERPAQVAELSGAAQPVLVTDREEHAETGIDPPQDDLEIAFGQRDAATSRL